MYVLYDYLKTATVLFKVSQSVFNNEGLSCTIEELNTYVLVRLTANSKAVPRLRQLIAGLSLRRPGFFTRPLLIKFMVDEVAI